MLLDVDHDVEISGRSARGSVLAFSVEPQPLAGCDARGNLNRQFSFAAHTAGAAARLTRLRNRFAGPAAVGAGARDGEKPLLVSELSRTTALTAGFGRAALGRARSFARFT